jgi:hypothetical protein
VTPNLVAPDGRLDPAASVGYMVADFGVSPVGDLVATTTHWAGRPIPWRLYRLSAPLRLRQSLEGVYWDAWGQPVTALNQFSLPDGRPREISVRVTRENGGRPLPATVTVRVGTIGLGRTVVHGQVVTTPALGTVLETRTVHVQRDLEHTFHFKAPKPPFRVETSVSPLPEAPASEFAPGVRRRTIAAQVYYSVIPR